MLLHLFGYDVSIAHDGEEALSMASELKPDVVLLDIGLPKLNGYDVARQIRLEPWGTTATLVAITGWGQAEDKNLSREAGFDHHLVKPVDYQLLTQMIEGLTNREIGQRLGLSPSMVKNHIGSILSKLGTKSRTRAVVLAVENKIIQP